FLRWVHAGTAGTRPVRPFAGKVVVGTVGTLRRRRFWDGSGPGIAPDLLRRRRRTGRPFFDVGSRTQSERRLRMARDGNERGSPPRGWATPAPGRLGCLLPVA